MNKIKPTILTLLAISFLALALQMVITDFNLVGFNKVVLVSISSVMAAIMFLASWFSWQKSFKETPKPNKTPKIKIFRFGKVLFASYGVAFAASLIIIVFGTWIFGFEALDNFISKYMPYTLLIITGISVPFVNKYLS